MEFARQGMLEVGIANDTLPGVFVNEMRAASDIANSERRAHEYLQFSPIESSSECQGVQGSKNSKGLRSAQIWCLSALDAQRAVEMICTQDLADHIDLNFGCPASKVTSVGGGCAVPLKPQLYREIVHAAVSTATEHSSDGKKIVVSAKFRTGLDSEHINYLDTAKIAIDEGVDALTLHARTAKQYYSGESDWEAIKTLRSQTVGVIPVFGNGDVFSAEDAWRMLEETKCDGVCIGRGILGRPWLFYEILTGKSVVQNFSDMKQILLHHLKLAIDFTKTVNGRSPKHAIKDFRVFIGPYLKGFNVNGNQKQRLMTASTLDRLKDILDKIDPDMPYSTEQANKPRGKTMSAPQIYLPEGWLD
ncbi:tRNA-dihydrouridine synthase [Actinomycetota bacterium]|nr:tRNA-dihydrouridine synthase [Actinomycetota bacterium]